MQGVQLDRVWDPEEDRRRFHEWESAVKTGNFKLSWTINDREQKHWPSAHQFWDGRSLDGKRIEVGCLHGLGDAVQMFQYAQTLEDIAGEVIYSVPSCMLPLIPFFEHVYRAIGTESKVPSAADRSFIEMLELPYILRTNVEQLPIQTRYLDRRGMLRERYKDAFSKGPQHLRVGIASQGSLWDRDRWICFTALKSILTCQETSFIFLQGHPTFTPRNIAISIPCLTGDMEELAGVIANLDLVISTDTLSAHLAGALGVPCWLLLKSHADWRWQLSYASTPWYPRTRIFRQKTAGDWTAPIAEVKELLEFRVGKPTAQLFELEQVSSLKEQGSRPDAS